MKNRGWKGGTVATAFGLGEPSYIPWMRRKTRMGATGGRLAALPVLRYTISESATMRHRRESANGE